MSAQKPRFGRSDFIHFRTDSTMREELDRLVAELRREGIKGVSRSSVARALLQKSLGNNVVRAEIREILAVVWMAVQKAMGRVTGEVERALPGHLEQSYLELAEKSGDVPAVGDSPP